MFWTRRYGRLGLAEVASNRRCARDDTMKYCSIDFDGLNAFNLQEISARSSPAPARLLIPPGKPAIPFSLWSQIGLFG